MEIQELFRKEISKEKIEEILKSYNFKDVNQINKEIDNLINILGNDISLIKKFIVRIFKILKTLPDPDKGLTNLIRFLENVSSPFITFTFINQDYKIIKTVLKIFSTSQFLANILIKKPTYLEYILFSIGVKKSYEELLQEGIETIEKFNTKEAKITALRRFQKREILRIGTNDIMESATIEEVTREVSILADVILELVYRIEKKDEEIAIISLGKLGGLELNYSSDIDIIFVCEDENTEKENILARKIIKDISEFSEEGFMYRIDTRLRPEGNKGSLVNNISFYRLYFENRARMWERQAYLRARFSAGNKAIGEKFIDTVKKFVYQKYMRYEDIQSVKLLKKTIEDQTISINEWKREVKTGFGGIRDIEFFTQFIQLIFGGIKEEIREINTFKALYKLYENRFIDFNEYKTLYKAYSFLRRLENFLQIAEYRQVHSIPIAEKEKEILAKKLNFKNAKEFDEYYTETTIKVRGIFEKYFKNVFEDVPEIDIYSFEDEKKEEIIERLKHYGITDPNSFYSLKEVSNNLKNKYLFVNTINLILKSIRNNAFDNNKALKNIIRVINAYQGADSFFYLIKNNEKFIKNIIKLVSFSDFIIEIIEKQPAVLDILTEEDIIRNPTTNEQLDTIISALSKSVDFKYAMKMLYEMEIFKIASMDIILNIDITEISRMLSVVAEKIIKYCINKVGFDEEVGFILLGKFGGKELSYHSDLDIVIVSNSEDINKHIEKTYKLIDIMSTSYNIDLRLRPNGKNSPVVVSFEYFKKYLGAKAEDWEKLIYSRSRVMSLSEETKKKIEEVIENFIENSEINTLKSNIISIREKIANSFPRDDFKKGYGGIIDIEFIVSYHIIKNRKKYEGLINTLNELIREKVIPDSILEDYLFLRKIENWIRLISNSYSSVLENQLIPIISKKIGVSDYELKEKYENTRERIKNLWEVFKR